MQLWLTNFKIYYGHSKITKIENELYSKPDKCTKCTEGKRQQKAVCHHFLKAFKTLSVMQFQINDKDSKTKM